MVTAAIALGLSLATTAVQAALTSVVINGPSSNRVDVVFLGDGYTSTDIAGGSYAADVASYVDYMFGAGLNTDPFHRYRGYFNVFRIDVVSSETGADVPPLNIFRDTALDASYYGDGTTERLLTVDQNKANAAASAALAGTGVSAEMKFVTVNDTRYGGSGGGFAVYAGGNANSHEIALHEVGHSFSSLADEYGGDPGPYTGDEPFEPNVTTDPTGAKWSRWHGYDQPGIGPIGVYTGARYYDSGLYRPSENSKMRSLGRAFDAIAREKIILDIYALTDPLDDWLENAAAVPDSTEFWVDEIDPDVIQIEWLVDGTLVAGAQTNTFRLADFGFGPGAHSVTARAFDPTGFDPVDGWVRLDGSSLEQTVTWNTVAVPEPANVLLLTVGIGLLLARAKRIRLSLAGDHHRAALKPTTTLRGGIANRCAPGSREPVAESL
jgi:hypothetical protein